MQYLLGIESYIALLVVQWKKTTNLNIILQIAH